MRHGVAPSHCQKYLATSTTGETVRGGDTGQRYTSASANRFRREAAHPERWSPAIGCEPTKHPSKPSARASLTMVVLVLPTSVTSLADRATRANRRSIAGAWSTGTAN